MVLIALVIILAAMQHTVAHCPDTCDCTGTTVNCMAQNLKSLPEGLPLDTTELNLNDNNMEILDLNSLRETHLLEGLGVSNNNIKTIKGSFEHFPNLRNVQLYGNELETLSQDTFGESLTWITYVSLSKNPWKCDCNMKWMIKKMDSNESSPFSGQDVKCDTPEELHGNFTSDLDVDKLTCKRIEGPGLQQKYIIVISVFAGIVGVFVPVAVAGYYIRRRRQAQGPLPLPIPAGDGPNAGNAAAGTEPKSFLRNLFPSIPSANLYQ